MRILQSEINDRCEYGPLDIQECQVTDDDRQYFRREPGEKDSSVPGNILVIVLLTLLAGFCVVWGFERRMYGLFIVVVFAAFMIVLNVMAVRKREGNSWEEYQKGHIRAAKVVVPNAYIVELPEYYNTGRRSVTQWQSFHTYETISTGLYEGEQVRILLKTMDRDGHSHSTYDEVSEELEERLEQAVGKYCLAKVHIRKDKAELIEIYIDRVLDEDLE